MTMVHGSGACGKIVGLHRSNWRTPYIAKIENGKQTGPVELAVQFSDFFEVSLDYLLVGKESFAEEQKNRLRIAISLLSQLEASL